MLLHAFACNIRVLVHSEFQTLVAIHVGHTYNGLDDGAAPEVTRWAHGRLDPLRVAVVTPGRATTSVKVRVDDSLVTTLAQRRRRQRRRQVHLVSRLHYARVLKDTTFLMYTCA